MKEDHPDKAKMALPVTSEVCQSCHGITYGEWRVSLHGQKNIRCFDCHKMHGMAQRKDKPDEMCGTVIPPSSDFRMRRTHRRLALSELSHARK